MLTVTDLTTLDTTKVNNSLALIVQLIQSYNPSIDVKRGALHDLLLVTSAALAVANQENTDLINQSTSLLLLQQNPDLADPALVINVASNFRLTPLVGSPAIGNITIVVSVLAPVVIANGTTFTSNTGIVFTADQLFTARVNPSEVTAPTDRLLTPVGNGNYYFTISVTAIANGSSGNVARNSQFTAGTVIPNSVSIYAAAAFTGGADNETLTHLIGRLPTGLANKSLSNRMTIDGLIRSDSEFVNIVSTSIIGYGDAEMKRYHSVLPVGFGGRIDIYARTANLTSSVLLTKTATLTAIGLTGGTWTVNIVRDDAPGFYEVDTISQTDLAGDYQVLTDVRNFDITVADPEVATPSTTFIPDVNSVLETAYTRYQTSTISFLDTDTPTTGLIIGTSTRDYAVALKAMPGIADLQDLVANEDARSVSGDCLVKAPIPCFVQIALTIEMTRLSAAINIPAVQQAVADAVNTMGFASSLSVSIISTATQGLLPTGTAHIANVNMTGRMRKPDGSILNTFSNTNLVVPEDVLNLVTSKTQVFILDPAEVTILQVIID